MKKQASQTPRKRLCLWKIVLFAVLFCVVLGTVQQVINHKFLLDEYWPGRFDTYRSLPRNSVDVVFLGTSMTQAGVSPNILWKEAGIASYNMSGSLHQHTFAEQKLLTMLELNTPPKYAVFTPTSLYGREFYKLEIRTAYHKFVSALPTVGQKVRAVLAMKRDLDAAGEAFDVVHFLLPILDYHSRWSNLQEWDVRPAWTYADEDPAFMLGQDDLDRTGDITDKRKPDDENATLNPEVEQMWRKVFALCRQNGITPVVLIPPRFDGIPTKAQLEATQRLCEESGAVFINYLAPGELERMAWDYTRDFAETVHLNFHGAAKLSRDLAQKLSALPGVSDHRGDPAYAVWDEYCAVYYDTYGPRLAEAQ